MSFEDYIFNIEDLNLFHLGTNEILTKYDISVFGPDGGGFINFQCMDCGKKSFITDK